MVRNQAQMIADFDSLVVEFVNRIHEHPNNIGIINNTVTTSFSNLCEGCRAVVATYETKEAAAALDAEVDAVNAQVQAVMTAVASYGLVNLPKDPNEFDVATPVHADDKQTAEVPGDPWQKAAEKARNQTGQSAKAHSSPFVRTRATAAHPAARTWDQQNSHHLRRLGRLIGSHLQPHRAIKARFITWVIKRRSSRKMRA